MTREPGPMHCIVVGAGTMGSQIAQVFAQNGCHCWLQDSNAEALSRASESIANSLAREVEKGRLNDLSALDRIHYGECPQPAEVDLFLEAVVEDLRIKKALFVAAEATYPKAILASNTSSLSLTEMAAVCNTPERVVGLHFFNPPTRMELVEIVRAEQTSDETCERALAWVAQWKKTPVVVRDVPGFASSRLGIILGMEAIRMLESQVASATDIDKAMELGYRHPMGPLKLTDLVGLDVRLAIAEHLTKEIGPQFQPPPLLRRMVRAGYLGKKSGRGFYRWEGQQAFPL